MLEAAQAADGFVNQHNPDRPHQAPDSEIPKRQRRNPGVTEIVKIPNCGYALTIDHGWQEVAQIALDFVKRFVPAKPS